MNHKSANSQETRIIIHWFVILLLFVLIYSVAIAKGAGGGDDIIAQIKSDFDTAMSKPLEERIALLEDLEQRIDKYISEGTLTGKAKADGLYYKYHIQLQLAKYPESYQTYILYLRSIKDYSNASRVHAVFYRDMDKLFRKSDFTNCSSICEQVASEFSSDANIASTALYYQARSQYRMIGMLSHCERACNKLISEYTTSHWRPYAMRLLAQSFHRRGSNNSALSMLDLLKQQYSGTKFEHYADMRSAAIYEVGKGNPQKALEVYQQSLQRYSDHFYSPYIHRQIERLRKIIEDQLIQDALEGIVNTAEPRCHSKSPIVKIISNGKKQMASRF